MEFTGEMLSVQNDWRTGKYSITFSVNEHSTLAEIERINGVKLKIKATKYAKRRSIDANAMLWACIRDIAGVVRADKWEIYLQMLKRYGKYTYICVKPSVVDAVKAQWRECEEIGEVEINGQKAVQMLCYFGSSTYDSKEFSILLDGVVSEMQELGLDVPASEDMKRSIELWEKNTA